MINQRTLPALAVGIVLLGALGLSLQAQQPAAEGEDMMKMPPQCQQMMERHQAMMQRHKEMDAELDRLVERMQSARGDEKIDATAAVVAELVTQRREMHDSMMGMCSGMMGHMMSGMEGMEGHQGGMKSCPMMKGMQGHGSDEHGADSDHGHGSH